MTGSQGGLVYTRDGVVLDVDAMSDEEVLALNRDTPEQRHVPPWLGAVRPIITSWGWNNTQAYNKAINELRQPGTHETLNGQVPTREEAERMIEEIGDGRRIEEGHGPENNSRHHEPQINYTLPSEDGINGDKATVIVRPWK